MTLAEQVRTAIAVFSGEMDVNDDEGLVSIMALMGVIRELANDLEAHINHEYAGVLNYSVMRRRYDRDMALVRLARDLLESMDGGDSQEDTNPQEGGKTNGSSIN